MILDLGGGRLGTGLQNLNGRRGGFFGRVGWGCIYAIHGAWWWGIDASFRRRIFGKKMVGLYSLDGKEVQAVSVKGGVCHLWMSAFVCVLCTKRKKRKRSFSRILLLSTVCILLVHAHRR